MAPRTPKLKQIEIENFKSYEGRHIIGSLKPFTAVIGPNGSGKSNFMDAISFVMGEKIKSLRVKRLSDLIHGSVIGRSVSKSASVTAVFTLSDNSEEVVFQRSVQNSSSEFKMNGSVVSAPEYSAELEKLNINVKTKNFLVFQGDIESIAMKNPKEMTALLEEISGSSKMKDEYEKLEKKMLEARNEIHSALQKKKHVNAERREAIMEKEEADKYSRIEDDLNKKLVEHQLFKAYHAERNMEIRKQELKSKQTELDKAKQIKENFEGILKDRKKEFGILNRELAKIEQNIREAEVEVYKKKPMFIKAKEEVAHWQRKADVARKTLDEAKKADEANIKNIQKLEKELAEALRGYENQLTVESQSQGIDIHLEDAQIRQYHKLKEEAAKRSAIYMQKIESVIREQKADQDTLDNISRLSREAEDKHSRKTDEKEEMVRRNDKLAEHIRTSEQALYDQNKLLKDLQQDVGSSKNKVNEVQQQLDEVLEQLGNAKTDKYEDSRKKKRQEIVNHFKAIYPGVYGRMINLCQPTHSRYNVAITKVIGKYMEAIVVDTQRTARQCIQYLKDQLLDPETFLPLDYLLAKPIDGRLRNITEPRGVKLLYDVLQYEPQVIKNAVLFATNNALVCESPEDANRVAFELGSRHNAVALDGTFYQKSGIISGGTVDLARKAKRWDEKHVARLEAEKERLTNEFREAMRKTRKESEITSVQSHITGLEKRLHYAKGDMNTTHIQIRKVEDEIANLAREIQRYRAEIEATQQDMQARERHIDKIKLNMNNVEDHIFSDFCRNIGVENIRQYEGRELRHHQERKQKCIEFQMQVDRIRNILVFETSRDTQTNVSRWERIVADEEGNLKSAKKVEAKQREEIDKGLKIVEELESQKLSIKKNVEKMDKDLGQARKDVRAANKEMQSFQTNVVSIESKIERLKSDRHAILLHCKMQDITIPMLEGNMEDIVATDQTPTSTNSTSSTSQQYERAATIRIDYRQLSDDLLDLEANDELKICENRLLKEISRLQEILQLIQAPNMKALEKLKQARGKLQLTNEEFEKIRSQNNEAKAAFEKIKNRRSAKFNQCFEHVAGEIDGIYKSLTQDHSAQAYLRVKNLEEPYLDGIDYDCVAPGKRFQRMSALSGGEKTIAALALLFAIHTYQPAPFFVLDEVDAALDSTNIGKLSKFISEKTESLQIILISLKEEFFSHANALIGIYHKPGPVLISEVVTMDLTGFEV